MPGVAPLYIIITVDGRRAGVYHPYHITTWYIHAYQAYVSSPRYLFGVVVLWAVLCVSVWNLNLDICCLYLRRDLVRRHYLVGPRGAPGLGITS